MTRRADELAAQALRRLGQRRWELEGRPEAKNGQIGSPELTRIAGKLLDNPVVQEELLGPLAKR